MILRVLNLAIIILLLACSSAGISKELNPTISYPHYIGEYAYILQEEREKLSLQEALTLYETGKFSASVNPDLNFGIGANPVWLIFNLKNPQQVSASKRLTIETSWLDNIEVYFLVEDAVAENTLVEKIVTGDRLPFNNRIINSRFFSFDYEFPPGFSRIAIRIATPDPMSIPVTLKSVATNTSNGVEGYGYGFLYGAIAALLVYNLILAISLTSLRYLYYSVYMAAFVAMNISYTGHGYQWIWSSSPVWQQWSNPVLMAGHVIAGFMFAAKYLETKTKLPRLHKGILTVSLLIAVSLLLTIFANNQIAAILVAFIAMVVFGFSMIFAGFFAYRRGNNAAKYFLLATILGSGGAFITAVTVWGFVPYEIGFLAIDIGMMCEAVLLALALASQFNIIKQEKNIAENLARLDPLTGLGNRRAFSEYSAPIWSAALRYSRDVAIILMDVDHFKKVNDQYGHEVGDDVLKMIAHVILKESRDSDIVARWGGEEFIVLLPDTPITEALAVAERYRHIIQNLELIKKGNKISITASFGVAIKHNQPTLDSLISIADNNLYKAKAAGRNTIVNSYESRMNDSLVF